MSRIPVRVSIPDAASFATILEQAATAGLSVDAEFDVMGMVTGTIEEAALPHLRAVPGIGSVEAQQGYEIPSPVSRDG